MLFVVSVEQARALLVTLATCSFYLTFAGVTCDHGLLWNIKASNVKASNINRQSGKSQRSKRPLRGNTKHESVPESMFQGSRVSRL